MANVLFFGYGAYRNKARITPILGHDIGEGVGAILEGYVLVYQTLNQLPEQVKKYLGNMFGPNFKAYSIKKGNGVIAGTIWEISLEDLATFKKWEFEGLWREFIEVKVKSSGGREVTAFTEKALDNQPFLAVTDGVAYEEFENHRVQKFNPTVDENYTKQQIEKIKAWLATQE